MQAEHEQSEWHAPRQSLSDFAGLRGGDDDDETVAMDDEQVAMMSSPHTQARSRMTAAAGSEQQPEEFTEVVELEAAIVSANELRTKPRIKTHESEMRVHECECLNRKLTCSPLGVSGCRADVGPDSGWTAGRHNADAHQVRRGRLRHGECTTALSLSSLPIVVISLHNAVPFVNSKAV